MEIDLYRIKNLTKSPEDIVSSPFETEDRGFESPRGCKLVRVSRLHCSGEFDDIIKK
jgi:hypothetical protein